MIAGRYRIERKIGTGGMGFVVSAVDEQMNIRVAIKLLRPEEPEPPPAFQRADESGVVDRSSKHEQLSTRLIREASAASRLSSAHVTRVLDVGRLASGDPYVVMELLEGVDLNRYIRSRGALSVIEAVNFVLQACEAIYEAHELGIVHRDLKPANLFLTQRPDGTLFVKVLDFGISKVLGADDNQLTQTSDMLGSPLYMAPEQIRNARDVDGRADVWSLGTILYRLIAGRAAFEAQGSAATLAAIISDAPFPLRNVRPDVPPELEAVILRCLEKDRAKRIQTVRELVIALQRFAVAQTGSFLAQVPVPSPAAVAGASVAPNAVTVSGSQKSPLTMLAVTAVLLAMLIGGGLVAWRVFGDTAPTIAARPGDEPAPGAAPPAPADSASAAPAGSASSALSAPAPTAQPSAVASVPSAVASVEPSASSTAASTTPPASAAPVPSAKASSTAKAAPRPNAPVQGKPSDDPLGDRY